MITASLNVSKIDKSKLIEGKKGKYLNIVLIETPNGQYGDYMVVQDTTKEERAKGVKGEILGNARVFQKGSGRPANAPGRAVASKEEDSQDISF